MIRAALCALILCACDPVWHLDVTVQAVDGAPLVNAAVVLTGCPEQDTHDLGTVAAMTDRDGQAGVGGLGTAYPESCQITVAHPGFASFESSFLELCRGDVSDCDRGQSITVVLEAQ